MTENISKLAIDIAKKLPDLTDEDLIHCITIFRLEQENRAEKIKQAGVKEIKALAEKVGMKVDIYDDDAKKTTDADADAYPQKQKPGPKEGTPASIKYYNPKTGEKWSGRGKPAKWLKALENQGQDISVYLVGNFKEPTDQENQ